MTTAPTCWQFKSWKKEGLNIDQMAIYISAHQFNQPDFLWGIDRIVERIGVGRKCIELELTDSMLVEKGRRIGELLSALKTRGFQLAIDDFGTDYSLLGYLQNFPIDRTKIAQTFIRDIPQSSSDKGIAKAIIALGHSLGVRIIAEGVETEEQADFLITNGCHEIQGYSFLTSSCGCRCA